MNHIYSRKRLMWAGHAWKKRGGPFVKAVIKENSIGKRSLGRHGYDRRIVSLKMLRQ